LTYETLAIYIIHYKIAEIFTKFVSHVNLFMSIPRFVKVEHINYIMTIKRLSYLALKFHETCNLRLNIKAKLKATANIHCTYMLI